MKKLLCSFLVVNLLVLSLIGCGKDQGPASDTTAAPSAETTAVPETEAETVAPENRLDVPEDLYFENAEMKLSTFAFLPEAFSTISKILDTVLS